ncbi:hypothetical protein [Saccharopolyspora griseoalba]|uniref:ABC transporter permease n=1 Tax=Saccharopolyspora griseoalba TaxID=1431848 RepID=A0ABW2LNA6_9PSEU
MSLLAVERIKLFSVRSTWWCMLLAIALPVGLSALVATNADRVDVSSTQAGYQFGLMVMLVLAALSITTEYRFSTIRATFLAVPNRVVALAAKTALVAGLGFLLGEVVAFGSWAVAKVLRPEVALALDDSESVRLVAGVGAVFAISAVLAVAVGALVRQTAGAVALLLVWSLLVEQLVLLIPNIGTDINNWMPFVAADQFLRGGGPMPTDLPYGPWGGLAYFAAITLGVWLVAALVVRNRDA